MDWFSVFLPFSSASKRLIPAVIFCVLSEHLFALLGLLAYWSHWSHWSHRSHWSIGLIGLIDLIGDNGGDDSPADRRR